MQELVAMDQMKVANSLKSLHLIECSRLGAGLLAQGMSLLPMSCV